MLCDFVCNFPSHLNGNTVQQNEKILNASHMLHTSKSKFETLDGGFRF